VAFSRELDVDSHGFLRSHVIQRKAVLPAAVMVEWLGHGALHEHPGLGFAGVDELRVLRGVKLDVDQTLGVEVVAGAGVSRGDGLAVPMTLRSEQGPHATAVVVLGPQPPAGPASLARPAGAPLRMDPYAQGVLFHGPDLRAIRAIESCGEEGVVVRAATAPAPSEWMKLPLRGSWLADPMALDAAFQAMIVWSFARRGVGSLPTGFARYRQYRRRWPSGELRVVALLRSAGRHEAVADVEFLEITAQGDRPLARMEGYACVLDASLAEAFRQNSLPAAAGR
jgi:hypothetical protein